MKKYTDKEFSLALSGCANGEIGGDVVPADCIETYINVKDIKKDFWDGMDWARIKLFDKTFSNPKGLWKKPTVNQLMVWASKHKLI